jgi:hypothetical protein
MANEGGPLVSLKNFVCNTPHCVHGQPGALENLMEHAAIFMSPKCRNATESRKYDVELREVTEKYQKFDSSHLH